MDIIKEYINKIKYSIKKLFKNIFNDETTEPLINKEIILNNGALLIIEEEEEDEITYRYSL